MEKIISQGLIESGSTARVTIVFEVRERKREERRTAVWGTNYPGLIQLHLPCTYCVLPRPSMSCTEEGGVARLTSLIVKLFRRFSSLRL